MSAFSFNRFGLECQIGSSQRYQKMVFGMKNDFTANAVNFTISIRGTGTYSGIAPFQRVREVAGSNLIISPLSR